MGVIQVRILEPWNGYKENSILTVTERVYYQTRTDGVRMHIVAESGEAFNDTDFKKEMERLHDKPFMFDEEE